MFSEREGMLNKHFFNVNIFKQQISGNLSNSQVSSFSINKIKNTTQKKLSNSVFIKQQIKLAKFPRNII